MTGALRLEMAAKRSNERFAMYGYTPRMSFIKGVEYYRQSLKEYVKELGKEGITDSVMLDLILAFVEDSNGKLELADNLKEQMIAIKEGLGE